MVLSRAFGVAALAVVAVLAGGSAASASVWQDVPESQLGPAAPERRLVGPHRVLRLDHGLLSPLLDGAPLEFTDGARQAAAVLELPWPDGGTRRFAIEVSPVMEPGLAQQFPDIQTYRGRGLDDGAAVGRFSLTDKGFHGIVLSPEGTVYVDPWSRADRDHYVSYFKRDYRRTDGTSFRCDVLHESDDALDTSSLAAHLGQAARRTFGETLRNYRAAVAATREYTTFHGGTVPLGLAAIVVTMNRVNTVYERDLAVHMNLVANNNLIVYTVEPDPYTNSSGSTMLGQNQTNLDLVIGSANYDIGHVFSTGGGGVASLGVVCNNSLKARGVTGRGSPVGDAFDIDYVAHEMGHQFRGNHTFNGSTSSCAGGNRNASTAWEPGSGSTIQAYAGICGAENLQLNSDDLFHVGSLGEMQAFVSNAGTGGSCSANVATGNTAPTVNGGPNFTIPHTTPFTLTATASDPDGDTLSYIWEQFDTGTVAPPNTDNGNRPIFRSFNVSTSPSRTFPRLSDVLAGLATPSFGEAWPTTNRTLNFRVTARDNFAGAGGTTIDTVAITVTAAAGPFVVTSPNTAVTWTGTTTQTVTWDVANTTAAPVSAATVNILLSTDGGQTFPTVLAAATPNDGSQDVTVPNTPTTQARVKVEAVGNVFFDIGNANFTIVAGGPPPDVSIGDVSVTEGNAGLTPAEFTVTLSSAPLGTVTVDFATADGTATASGNDYVAASGTVTFLAGQTTRPVTVNVVGDVAAEANETFFVNLTNLSSGGAITDGQGQGTIQNDDGVVTTTQSEVGHGSEVRRALGSAAGDTYRFHQRPRASYEVVVDEASGDLAPVALDRVGPDGTSVLQSAQPVGSGQVRSLRWLNAATTEVVDQRVRVQSGGCAAPCGPDDLYRIRAYETTGSIARFNNSGSQVTVLLLQNATDGPIVGTIDFWSPSGTLLGSQPFTANAKSSSVLNTSAVSGVAGVSGTITIAHDGRYGELAGKAVALEPATGFSFDSPMTVRAR